MNVEITTFSYLTFSFKSFLSRKNIDMKTIHTILIFFFLFFYSFSQAQSHTWVGGTGTLWSTASNWSPSNVPGAGSFVRIDIGATVNLDISTSIAGLSFLGTSTSSGHLIIDATKTLTITNRGIRFFHSGSQLTVNGNLDISHTDATFSGIRNDVGGTITINNGAIVSIDDIGTSANGIISSGPVTNDGTISISNVAANEGLNITASTLTNNGTITIASSIANTFALRGNIVNSASGIITGTSTNSTATIFNDVSLNGCTIAPGNSPGQLSFRTGFAPTAGTTYLAEIQKIGASLSSDLLYLFGSSDPLNFDITNVDVVVTKIGVTALSVGDEFTILSAPSGYTGPFASINLTGPPLPASSEWTVTYATTTIKIKVTSLLPVELTGFKANIEAKNVALSWQTASETNNKGFFILRSDNARSWTEIGFITGNGSSTAAINYQFIDTKPMLGKNYYQLKQMDYDGSSELSPIQTVVFGDKNNAFILFPNPSDGIFTIDGQGKNDGQTASVYTSEGQLMMKVIITNNKINLSDLLPGTYFLKIGEEHQKVFIF